MKLSKPARRTATALVAMGAALVALVGLMGAPASASVVGVGVVKLCTGSNYSAYVQFQKDYRGGLASTIVTPGSCWRGEVGGLNHAESIEFRGIWNTNPNQSFLIYTAEVNLSQTGLGVTVAGTTTSPTHTVW